MLLLNTTHPYFRILIPETGEYAEFIGGKLEIEPDDPRFAVVMAEAQRNPLIAVYESTSTCPHCGEVTSSAKALRGHVHDVHFDKFLEAADVEAAATRNVEIKARAAGFPCDVCTSNQVFGSEADLALHAKAFHAAAPTLDDEGNERGGAKASAATTEVPAAKPSRSK